jgi:iron complex transport system ATP-binding protein
VLAQVWEPVGLDGPRWLLLDEPVASLDIAHQLQVMEIARRFADAGGGVVAVMHDLNLTAMYAARIALISGGRIAAMGPTAEALTDSTLSQAYGCRMELCRPPPEGSLFLLPHSCRLAS